MDSRILKTHYRKRNSYNSKGSAWILFHFLQLMAPRHALTELQLQPPCTPTSDFNCTPDALVHQFLTGRSSLLGRGTYWRDAYQRRHQHSDGFTWSARNPHVVRNVERNRRLDYVFVGPMKDDGPGAVLHARVVLDLAGHEQVFPSDHFGVFAEIALEQVENGV